MNRRQFVTAALGFGVHPHQLWGDAAIGNPGDIDESLRSGIARRRIPAVVGMVATPTQTLYIGAFGRRDSESTPVATDSIFAIASMTKAVTTVAAMQLVEQGKMRLDEPVSKYLPQLNKLSILQGFDARNGKPILRPAKTRITLKHLLTHTSGLCYDTWDEKMFRFASHAPASSASAVPPLMFEPGSVGNMAREWIGPAASWRRSAV
jgi:CubicO group peptidase (beta-lactamase class C family)